MQGADMQFNAIGLVVDALELAGVPKADAAVVLDKLAQKQDQQAQGVSRLACGGAAAAGQVFVDALRADAGVLRRAAEGLRQGLRQTAKREAEEAAEAEKTASPSKPKPGTVLAEVR